MACPLWFFCLCFDTGKLAYNSAFPEVSPKAVFSYTSCPPTSAVVEGAGEGRVGVGTGTFLARFSRDLLKVVFM